MSLNHGLSSPDNRNVGCPDADMESRHSRVHEPGAGAPITPQDRDVAVEARILRAVDLAHPARTQRSKDFIEPEFLARSQTHGFLIAASQFTTKVSCDPDFGSNPLLTRNFCPSAVASNDILPEPGEES